ncbi:MAG: carboxypeptidase regulatory-like domain-containing protein [Fibrobacter sp.]|nr:carboxypeptidase regulatory-like domain-containing protein [Fibrobacter sp.]
MRKAFLLLPWVFLLLCCSETETAGGPGSETTNGIVAYVDGAPAAFASVALRRIDQKASLAALENSVIQPDFFADSNGRFVLDTVSSDNEFRMTVVSGGSAFSRTFSAKELSKLDTVELTATGSVSGVVDLPKGSEYAWVGVYGMDMLVKTDAEGKFALPTVPSGDSLKLYFAEESYDSVYESHKVVVQPYGVETVNLKTEGIVAVSKGKVVPFATVAVRPVDQMVEDSSNQTNSIIVSEIRADSNGRFVLDSLKKGNYRLTVVDNGIAYSKVLSAKEIEKLDTVELSATGSLVGRVTLRSDMMYAYVGVYGMDVLVKTDMNGSYVFPSLPVGDSVELYFVTKKMEKLPVEVKTVVDENTADFHAPSMTFENFEDSFDYWYTATDSLGSFMKPSPKDSSIEKGVEYDSTRKSNVFHGQYWLGNSSYAWVLVGTNLRDHVWNLSLLDSIVFYAKGDGQIRVAVENWDKVSEELSMNLKAASEWKDLDTAKWQRYVIEPSDLIMNALDNAEGLKPWTYVKGWVKQLNFFAQGGSNFYIDDIKLYGVLF